MPETTPSSSEQFSTAVDAAVAQHADSTPADSGAASQSDVGATTQAPAAGSGSGPQTPAPSSSVTPTTQASDADDEQVIFDEKQWTDPAKRRTVLQNARNKEAARVSGVVRQRMEQALGFSLNDEQAQNNLANVRAFIADPKAYLSTYAQHFGFAPGPQAQPNGNGQVQGFQRPKATLVAADGTPAYAAPEIDAVLDYLVNRIGSLEQGLTPLQEMRKRQEMNEIQAEIGQRASAQYADMQTWPRFKEFEPKIFEMMQADKRVTPESAYRTLLTKALPDIEAAARKAAIDDLNKSQTTPPKGGPSSLHSRATPGKARAKNFDEAVDQAVAQLGL